MRHPKLAIGVPLAIACAILVAPVWKGPIILSLSAVHGVDTGDLLATPFVLLAIAAARRRRGPTEGRALPVATAALGVVLLLAGVLAEAGGPLEPAGGATLDGTIQQTIAGEQMPVERWTSVALTYDGATQRLYVNGREVSSHAASGRIQTPGTPLWIGGNRPYGEHFDGLLDEVRVYDRALSAGEIRADMDTPVRPARGLVAGYAFDAGAGASAKDASGDGNTGRIAGATWARGRFGSALRFNGADSVVRVPPSRSLDLTTSMTLSAWLWPRKQTGWRTIVQRQTDAFFLTASSGRHARLGAADAIRIALVVAIGAWFLALIASGRGPWTAARRRTWWAPVALFALGALADAAFAPSAALCSCILVALWLAATATGAAERALFLLAAAVLTGLTVASLTDVAGVAHTLGKHDGATARTTALGALFVLAGVASAAGLRRGQRDRRQPLGGIQQQ